MLDKGIAKKPNWAPVAKNAPPKTRRNAMRRTTINNLAVKSSAYPIIGVTSNKNGKTPTENEMSKKLPMRQIKKMATQGMKPKRIAAELIKLGYKNVDYRTIARKIAK